MKGMKALKTRILPFMAALAIAGTSMQNAQATEIPTRKVTAKFEDTNASSKGLELVIETDLNHDGEKEQLVFRGDGTDLLSTVGIRNADFLYHRKTGRTVAVLSMKRNRYILNMESKGEGHVRAALHPLEEFRRRKGQYMVIVTDKPHELSFIYKPKEGFSRYMNSDPSTALKEFKKYHVALKELLIEDEKEISAPKAPDSSILSNMIFKVNEPTGPTRSDYGRKYKTK